MKKIAEIIRMTVAFTLTCALALTLGACGGSDNSTAGADGAKADSSVKTESQVKSPEGTQDMSLTAGDNDQGSIDGVIQVKDNRKAGASGVSDDTLTVAIGSEPTSLNPHVSGAYGGVIDNCLYESLIFFDSNTGEYEPWLAESWEVIDDTTTRYYLRKDVTAFDGSGITASDVLFTFQTGIANPESTTDYSIYDVEHFNIVDDYTIDIKTTAPNGSAFVKLADTAFAILDESSTTAAGGPDASATEPKSGTGPYKFVEWKTGEYVKLERNEDYWGEAPYYKEIIVRFIADETTRSLSLEAGDVDAITGVSAAQADTLVADGNLNVMSQTSANAVTLCMNTARSPLDDLNVRKAIACAINKEAIVAIFCEGYGTVLDTVVSPSNPLCADLAEEYDYHYDPEKAKQYLSDAGYEDGLTLQLLYYDANELIAEVLQNNLAEVGITLELNCSEVWNDINEKGDFDMLLCTFFGRTNTQIFGLMDNRIDYSGRNHDAFGDDSYNADLDKLYQASDPSAVLDVSQKLMETFQENIPSVGICSTDYLYAASGNLTGFYTSTGFDQLLLYKLRPAAE